MNTQHTLKTRIADLKVGDIVHAHGGLFEVMEHPFDSNTHSTWKDLDGWCVGPAGVAVAKAKCLEGHVSGYFWPGSEWTFQGATSVTVSRVEAA
jgi:hypothetical protein